MFQQIIINVRYSTPLLSLHAYTPAEKTQLSFPFDSHLFFELFLIAVLAVFLCRRGRKRTFPPLHRVSRLLLPVEICLNDTFFTVILPVIINLSINLLVNSLGVSLVF